MTTPGANGNPSAVLATRVRYLDVLRGIALLGILPVNIPLFAMPVTAASESAWVTGGAISEHIAFHATRFFFEMKFITLFSLLFGVGMAVQWIRAEASGRSYVPLMLRRLGALLFFGLAHAVLIWFGDILVYYAVLGLFSFWAVSWSPRTLRRTGIVLIAVPIAGLSVLAAVVFALQEHAAFREVFQSFMESGGEGFAPGSTKGSWEDFFAALQHFGPAFETEVYREGSFGRITFVRAMTWFFGLFMLGAFFVWRIAGLFLLGMAWAKDGWFLDPAAHRDRFRRLVVYGLVAGVPLQAAATALDIVAESPAGAVLSQLFLYSGSLGIAAAYAGIIGLFAAGQSWSRPFEAVGRTAFSNYIFQSLVCTTLFYAYGFALFGRVDRAQLWLIVLGVWMIQLLSSPLWTRRFRFGPLEWLWRTATYGRMPS